VHIIHEEYGLLCCNAIAVRRKPVVSEEHTDSIFRVEEVGRKPARSAKQAKLCLLPVSCCFLACLTLLRP
jgi:hypothetical protein